MARSPFADVSPSGRDDGPDSTADRGGPWHGGGQAGVMPPSMQIFRPINGLAAAGSANGDLLKPFWSAHIRNDKIAGEIFDGLDRCPD
jgi:hypothetical protein